MPKLSLKTALLIILGSTFLFTGSIFGSYLLFFRTRSHRLHDPRFNIVSIVQTGPEKEALKTTYLAELLELSTDKKINLFTFDVDKAEEKLLRSPLIKYAKVKRLRPGTIYVDYEVRHPVALLQDYDNVGIDREGYPLPLRPFFSEGNLPKIYLGENGEIDWHKPLKGKKVSLAFQLLNSLSAPPYRQSFLIKNIDVSKAFSSSYGRREIVLQLQEALRLGQTLGLFSQWLRLNPKDYEKQMSNFLVLQEKMLQDYKKQLEKKKFTQSVITFTPKIIDFRIPELAFIKE